jgi:hypothetical protein
VVANLHDTTRPASSRGHFTSARSIRQRPATNGRITQAVPVTASCAHSLPVRLPGSNNGPCAVPKSIQAALSLRNDQTLATSENTVGSTK